MKRTLLTLTTLMTLASVANAQDFNNWTTESLKKRFGANAIHVKYVDRKIKSVTFGPGKHFHNDGCFNLILQILRGPDIPNSDRLVADPNLESNDDDTVWIDHKTGVFINQLQGFVFVAVKVSDVTKPAESAGSIVLTAHLVDDEQEEWFVLQTP